MKKANEDVDSVGAATEEVETATDVADAAQIENKSIRAAHISRSRTDEVLNIIRRSNSMTMCLLYSSKKIEMT